VSGLYRKGKNAILEGWLRWSEASAEALLLDLSVYTVDLEAASTQRTCQRGPCEFALR
jgi:hypothetical protein